MILLTEELREQLLANGRNRDADHIPVVKFFNPLGEGVWLATELDEDGDGVADWRSCAEAAAAIMVGPCAPRASRGPLRPDLRVVCPSLTLDELVLLSARALGCSARRRAASTGVSTAASRR